MSKEALNWLSNQKIHDPTLKAVLHSVALLANRGTAECVKSQGAIALSASLSDRTVREALIILERLEMISRRARSNGRSGRTTDAITLPLDRTFDISKQAVKIIRQSVRTCLQPAPRATGTKSSNWHQAPLQPAPRASVYNTVNTEDALSVGYPDLAPTVDVENTCEASSKAAARSDCNVLPFKRGGAA